MSCSFVKHLVDVDSWQNLTEECRQKTRSFGDLHLTPPENR